MRGREAAFGLLSHIEGGSDGLGLSSRRFRSLNSKILWSSWQRGNGGFVQFQRRLVCCRVVFGVFVCITRPRPAHLPLLGREIGTLALYRPPALALYRPPALALYRPPDVTSTRRWPLPPAPGSLPQTYS